MEHQPPPRRACVDCLIQTLETDPARIEVIHRLDELVQEHGNPMFGRERSRGRTRSQANGFAAALDQLASIGL